MTKTMENFYSCDECGTVDNNVGVQGLCQACFRNKEAQVKEKGEK